MISITAPSKLSVVLSAVSATLSIAEVALLCIVNPVTMREDTCTGLDHTRVRTDVPRFKSKASSSGGNMSGITSLAIKAAVVLIWLTGLLLRSVTTWTLVDRKVLVRSSPNVLENPVKMRIGRRRFTL